MTITNSGTVEIEINGLPHNATYTVWKDVVKVEYNGTSKSTQVGGLTPEAVARLLLSEIINKS